MPNVGHSVTPSRLFAAITAGAILLSSVGAMASSHREAPMISQDPAVDATDLYAFVSPDKPDMVTLIANYIPFEEPAGGPNFNRFDDNALYEIKVDNNGDAVEDISYQFKFTTKVQDKSTFLYNGAPITTESLPNVFQTYTLTKVMKGKKETLAKDILVPAVNIGPKSTPNYAQLYRDGVKELVSGLMVFAGPVDDPFFVDLGSVFDLLTIRKLPGNMGGGVDNLKGYNVHALALQVPMKDLVAQMPKDAKDPNAVIGVWTTASRKATRVFNKKGKLNQGGRWVQVSRLGAPLVNEVVIPLSQKDLWNSSKPADDGQYANSVTDPEVGKLFKALYNIAVPPQGAFGTKEQRDDLIAIFLTGIAGLNQPANVKPSEQLRLNVMVPPTAVDKMNTLGVVGGDNQGFPNGRRLADDVTDIALKAVAGAAYPLFHPDFKADETGTKLGDGVDKNDEPFMSSFPYLAPAHSGFETMPHGK